MDDSGSGSGLDNKKKGCVNYSTCAVCAYAATLPSLYGVICGQTRSSIYITRLFKSEMKDVIFHLP